MSTRSQLKPELVITNGEMSDDIISEVTVIPNISMVSYSYSWDGDTPVGVVSIQLSNDFKLGPDGSVANAGTWNTATLNYGGSSVTSVPITGDTGNGLIDIEATAAYAIRTVYTADSGDGLLNVTIAGKVS